MESIVQIENMVNLVLCVAIVMVGYMAWQKSRKQDALLVAAAFGFFGLSHLITLLGLGVKLGTYMVGLRLVAYLLVLFALYRVSQGKK